MRQSLFPLLALCVFLGGCPSNSTNLNLLPQDLQEISSDLQAIMQGKELDMKLVDNIYWSSRSRWGTSSSEVIEKFDGNGEEEKIITNFHFLNPRWESGKGLVFDYVSANLLKRLVISAVSVNLAQCTLESMTGRVEKSQEDEIAIPAFKFEKGSIKMGDKASSIVMLAYSSFGPGVALYPSSEESNGLYFAITSLLESKVKAICSREKKE